jgi:multidrug efflux pump subunit AcrA (membrane-fusion protein)
VQATQGTLQRTIRVSGTTGARNYSTIIAPRLQGPDSRGSLILLSVAKGGSHVKKGDLVAQIDAQTATDHIDDVKANVEQAQMDIKKRQAEQAIEWETLQQTLRVAKAELDKAKLEVTAAEVRTVIDQELLRLSAEESEARYKQLQADLGQKQRGHRAELRILEITAERQVRHLRRHDGDVRKFNIQAPMDGLVVMMTIFRGPGDMAQIQQGDQVFPGQPIMKIVNPASMHVEANVNQAESAEFRINQKATVGLDAFPGLTLPGKIYSIGALASGGFRQNFYIRNVPLRINVEGTDPRLIPDLSAAVDIVIESAPESVIVPLGAVTSHEGKPAVFVKTAQGFEPHEVAVALKNYTHAAITDGLKPGDEVRLN